MPQPKVMSQSFHDAGLKLAASIKPCLLQDHPRYGEVAERGLFIRDSQTDAPERSSFWDDEGSHLDFTNPQTVAWRQEGVTTQLLEMGIDSTWNDNNEYEVWDGEARCYGFGREIAINIFAGDATVDDARLAGSPAALCAAKAPISDLPLRLRRDAALRPDLERRQPHQLGYAAL